MTSAVVMLAGEMERLPLLVARRAPQRSAPKALALLASEAVSAAEGGVEGAGPGPWGSAVGPSLVGVALGEEVDAADEESEEGEAGEVGEEDVGPVPAPGSWTGAQAARAKARGASSARFRMASWWTKRGAKGSIYLSFPPVR
jgi:hypothetical protein